MDNNKKLCYNIYNNNKMASLETPSNKKNILFFDDNPYHVENMQKSCNNIKGVWIPHKDLYFHKYLSMGNLYARILRMYGIIKEIHTPSRAITGTEINIIYKWFRDTTGTSNRKVLFDWDKTLSQCSGFYIPNDTDNAQKRLIDINNKLQTERNETKIRMLREEIMINDSILRKTYIDDMLIYLLGGQERVKMIKDMIKFLLDNNIQVYIVSSNPNGSNAEKVKYNRGVFVEMLQKLDARLTDSNLISSHDTGDNKVQAILNKNICNLNQGPTPRGGKLRKNRPSKKLNKNKLLKKQSKKHVKKGGNLNNNIVETTQGAPNCPANNPTMDELAWDNRYSFGKNTASGWGC